MSKTKDAIMGAEDRTGKTIEELKPEEVYIVDKDVEAEIQAAYEDWQLSQFTTEQLNLELERRGYVNGVLIHPEKDV